MYEIQRNPTEKLIIQKNEFKGKEYIDIRIFYEDEGEYKPTKKGVTFDPDQIDEVIKALESIKEESQK